MFLHLGGDAIVNGSDVIAILDLDSASNAASTIEFMNKAQKSSAKITRIVEDGKDKTLVITSNGLYLSPISSYTLMKRAQNSSFQLDLE